MAMELVHQRSTRPAKMRLTATQLAAVKPNDAKRDISDAAVAGLVLRVSPNGAKHWLFRYTWKKARPRIALGQFPAVGLAEARKLAMECSEWLEKGVDPRRAARRHRRERKHQSFGRPETSSDVTVQQVAAQPDADDPLTIYVPDKGDRSSIHFLAFEYVEHYVKPTLANAEEVVRILKKDVLTTWNGRDARTIKPREVIDLLDSIVDRGSPVMANRTATYLGQMFKFGIHRTIVDDSPVKLLYKPGGKEKPRDRALSEDELEAFVHGHAVACVTAQRAHCLMFLLLTLQRGTELSLATWSEFDFMKREWHVPRQHSKNRLAHVVPLTDWALEELMAPKELSRCSRFVLPDDTGDGHENPKLLTRGVARLLPRFKVLGINAFTPRDLKRTGRTNLGRLRVVKRVAELVINHVKEKLEGTYDVYEYLTEKRKALEFWETYLRELKRRPVSDGLKAAMDGMPAPRTDRRYLIQAGAINPTPETAKKTAIKAAIATIAQNEIGCSDLSMTQAPAAPTSTQ